MPAKRTCDCATCAVCRRRAAHSTRRAALSPEEIVAERLRERARKGLPPSSFKYGCDHNVAYACEDCKRLRRNARAAAWQCRNRELFRGRARESARRSRLRQRLSPEHDAKLRQRTCGWDIRDTDLVAVLLSESPVCEACRRAIDVRRDAHIDHDHKTNRVRGLLCRGCNVALGALEDSETHITGLLDYLRRHEQ